MRELEILKDRLLAMFRDEPGLSPADVAVLTPDINGYAPYIDAVFGARAHEDAAPDIPYSIADRRIVREEPLLASYAALLDLADSRFAADQVLALLDAPALLRRFGLGDADVPFIQQWVRESGIRWGRDAAHTAWRLPADPLFTWRWGLDRLLLGAVLPPALAGDDSGLFAGLLPHGSAQASWRRRWDASPPAIASWSAWPRNGRGRRARRSGLSVCSKLASACSTPTPTRRTRWRRCARPWRNWRRTLSWPVLNRRWACRWCVIG